MHKQSTPEIRILDKMFMLNASENHGFASLFCVLRPIWIPFFFLFIIIILGIIFQLMKPGVFDFIEKYNLHDAIRDKVCRCKIG
jgi:hypothetical protein